LENVITPTLLVKNKQVKKAITSVTTLSRMPEVRESALEQAILSGEVEVELVPQGTLAERIRAGGAGLGGFYSPVGVDTILAEGKEKRKIGGKEYLFELPLRADFGFVRAYRADKIGNLIYKGTSRSFNPLIAMAADVTIAEVDHIVEVGELDPECIITPCVLVDRIVKIESGGNQ
jgi:3-oxoacid CoA-transferase A subunit